MRLMKGADFRPIGITDVFARTITRVKGIIGKLRPEGIRKIPRLDTWRADQTVFQDEETAAVSGSRRLWLVLF